MRNWLKRGQQCLERVAPDAQAQANVMGGSAGILAGVGAGDFTPLKLLEVEPQ
jgi:hypothetical protein